MFCIGATWGENCIYFIFTFAGKMELLSSKFQDLVHLLFEKNKSNIIATIPLPKGKPIPFVESLRNRSDCKTFLVTLTNRNTVGIEIMSAVNNQ